MQDWCLGDTELSLLLYDEVKDVLFQEGLLFFVVGELHGEFGARDADRARPAYRHDIPLSARLKTLKRMLVLLLDFFRVFNACLRRYNLATFDQRRFVRIKRLGNLLVDEPKWRMVFI